METLHKGDIKMNWFGIGNTFINLDYVTKIEKINVDEDGKIYIKVHYIKHGKVYHEEMFWLIEEKFKELCERLNIE